VSKRHLLDELRPDQLEECLRVAPVLVIPIGTIEWHSHHLPLGLDGLKAEAIAARVTERFGAILAPTSWWAAGGVPYPYTLRLPLDLVEALLAEVLVQFAAMGFRVIVLVNGHYGLENSLVVRRVAISCMRRTPTTVLPVAEYELLIDVGARGDHAGTWETSLLWAVRPDLVALEGAPDSLEGVVGDDPRGKASPDLGSEGIERVSEGIIRGIERCLRQDALARERLVGALEVSVKALEAIARLRMQLPRHEAPPVITPSWLKHLRSFHEGRYEDAAKHANEKLSNPEK
jgi:creatinine amidohydrolase